MADKWLKESLRARFLRYVKVHTTSDRHISSIPSTECQWDLIRMLEQELHDLGISDVKVFENGYVIAVLPASEGIQSPVIGLMAHVDTSEDAPGKNVKPKITERYDGSVLDVGNGVSVDPVDFPVLASCLGHEIISSDGTTLLGADDKAGIAIIMTAAEYLLKHPEMKHGILELVFTPDEETGKGLDLFPVKELDSVCCYTLDGDTEACIESECFNAVKAEILFKGRMIHPGKARGQLINAITLVSKFLQLLPQAESPEATDGRYGFYYPHEITGSASELSLEMYLRDFESDILDGRISALRKAAEAVEAAFPGSEVKVSATKQYSNMRDYIEKDPRILNLLREAVRNAGMEPLEKPIRGGTDGARLSEMGIPAPNIFTGGQNFHSLSEWVSLDVMEKSTLTVLELVKLWSLEKTG